MKTRRMRLVVLVLPCALLVGACGSSSKTISQQSESNLARQGLTAAKAGPAKSIDCPSGVSATVGKTLTCHVTFEHGPSITLTEKVDRISGSSGHLTIVDAKRS